MSEFIVPKEPRLHWHLLRQPLERRQRQLPTPVEAASTHYFSWARNAIYHGLRALGVSPGDTILVPAYHCATLVEPIIKYGAKVNFYNILRDCSPDFSDIEARIDKDTRAILAIHYFGFPTNIGKFQELCKNYNLFLIEDCAHVLTGVTSAGLLGSFGDISVFSWRKFFPIFDGGLLIINNSKLHANIPWKKHNIFFHLKLIKNIIDELIDNSSNKAAKRTWDVICLPYTLYRRHVVPNGDNVSDFVVDRNDQGFDLAVANLKTSFFSTFILRNIDIPTVFNERRVNYTLLNEALESIPGITPFFPKLLEGVCPWVFPVLAHGRQDFHLALRSKGIPAVTWGGVIHPELPLAQFPDANFLYQNLVLLPTHQSLEDSEIRLITDTIEELLC